MEVVIGSRAKPVATDALIAELAKFSLPDAILYVGYPILSTADDVQVVDAMLTGSAVGVLVFDLIEEGPPLGLSFWTERVELHTRLYLAVKSKLMREKSLCEGRELAVPLEVLAFSSTELECAGSDVRAASPRSLSDVMSQLETMDPRYVRSLNAVVQRVVVLKPPKKRLSVSQSTTRGAVLKRIEKNISNLDRYQNRAAVEWPDGPQRIRGLAGSGKTIVLALKAAYLHALHPEWTIAVTFYTRSLYDQFTQLIRRFSYEHTSDEPDWSHLRVLHAWGGSGNAGVYSQIASSWGYPASDFLQGRSRHGALNAFQGVCDELLSQADQVGRPVFDAVLIDEAQDLPASFFQLVYMAVPDPRRIVWAYDDMQNLGSFTTEGPDKLFGSSPLGVPRVPALRNPANGPHQDIILPVCYRNTPWALAIAHALGLAIYRDSGPVQMFDDPKLWLDIGYEVVDGDLRPGQSVTVVRRSDCSPAFFRDLLTPEDAVKCLVFKDYLEEARWVADDIATNSTKEELELSDFLVIFCNPKRAASDASVLLSELKDRGIEGHIAGVTRSRDEFFVDGSIVVSGIYRAKGNEAPMVYVLNSEYCALEPELTRKRNILFTAITRSRGWVRICGCGPDMGSLRAEFDAAVHNNYRLTFRVPTEEELDKLRRIHRDMTADELRRVTSVQELVDALEKGDMPIEALPKDIVEKLLRLLNGKTQ